MRIVTVNEMAEIERTAKTEFGFSEDLIIENVGLRVSEYLFEKYLSTSNYGEVVLFAGKGNNASDGFSVARHLRRYNLKIRVFMCFPQEECNSECLRQMKLAETFGVKISEVNSNNQIQSYLDQRSGKPFVIDAIFGTGVRLPVSNLIFDIFNLINYHSKIIVSLDIPSGIDGNTGRLEGNSVNANETLAIGMPKLGHFLACGAERIGHLKIVDGGFPNQLVLGGNKTLLTPSLVAKMKQERDPFAHKNSFGHTLLIGGSPGLTGALILASNAASRVGSGLVTTLTWEKSYPELASRIAPEIITGAIPEDMEVIEKRLNLLKRYTSVIIGPGLGKSKRSREVVIKLLLSYSGPVVIDADAINVLNFKDDFQILQNRIAPTVITPHLGEFARFMNCTVPEISNDPLEKIQKFIEGTNCSVVLKGPSTYLGLSNNELYVNFLPNSGMATGGSGDVLAGILGGLIAQNHYSHKTATRLQDYMYFYDSICLGTVVHSLSGEHAAKNLGERAMNAGSIVVEIPQAFKQIKNTSSIYSYEHIQ